MLRASRGKNTEVTEKRRKEKRRKEPGRRAAGREGLRPQGVGYRVGRPHP
jgi:hypothetical protein